MTTAENIELLEFSSLCYSTAFNVDHEEKYANINNDEYGSRDRLKFLDNFAKLLRCTKGNVVAMAPYLSPEGVTKLYIAENMKTPDFEKFVNSIFELCKNGIPDKKVRLDLLNMFLQRNKKIMTQKFTKVSKVEAVLQADPDHLSKRLLKANVRTAIVEEWELRKREKRVKALDNVLLAQYNSVDIEGAYELIVRDYVRFFENFKEDVRSLPSKGPTVRNIVLANLSRSAATLHRSSLYPIISETYGECLGKYIRQTATHEIATATIIECLNKKSFKSILASAELVIIPSDVKIVELKHWREVAKDHGAREETIECIAADSRIGRFPKGKAVYAVHAEMAVLKEIIKNHPNTSRIHVGVSKLCCRSCAVAVRALNNRGQNIAVSVTHNKVYKLWTDPGLGVGTAVLEDYMKAWQLYLTKMSRSNWSDSDQDGDLTDDEELTKAIAKDMLRRIDEDEYPDDYFC